MTPKGIELTLSVIEINVDFETVSCAVQKDSGDDPDVTDKILVFAKVEKQPNKRDILIEGGTGVGRVTKPGLACEVGQAAINPIPRLMIATQVRNASEEFDYEGGFTVTISIPEGIEIAKRTYNPRLGIVDGISVLGTSGIVEPMSEKALIDSIKVEMNMLKASGYEYLLVSPGNYGTEFSKMQMNISIDNAIQCSNFIGDVIDYGISIGIKGMLMIGHAGKFIKLAAGIMNTHSRYADGRMEILTAHAALAGADINILKEIMDCVTADEAIRILINHGMKETVMRMIIDKIDYHLKQRTYGNMQIEAIMFTNRYGILAQTGGASELLRKIQSEDK